MSTHSIIQPQKHLSEFQQMLYEKIPLTQAMQLKIKSIDGNTISIFAPLEPNINDKGTVFGGSSVSLMIIAGWSLIKLHLLQLKLNHDLVISRNQCQWLKPLSENFFIEASYETINQIKNINKNRKNKIHIHAQISNSSNEVCNSMHATYVTIPCSP